VGHLVDRGSHERQVCSYANSGDDSGEKKGRIVPDEGMKQGAEPGDEQGEQKNIASPKAVGQRAEDECADHVSKQIEEHGYPNLSEASTNPAGAAISPGGGSGKHPVTI